MRKMKNRNKTGKDTIYLPKAQGLAPTHSTVLCTLLQCCKPQRVALQPEV